MLHQIIHQALPQFIIYPKRRTSKETQASMYLRITYGIHSTEKSLGIRINFSNWNAAKQKIISQPNHDAQLRQTAAVFEQKIMGSYYELSRHGGTFTLHEIMQNAFSEKQENKFSLFGVFENAILNLEKLLKPGQSMANLCKHRTCQQRLLNYLKINYNVSDIGFNRISRSFIDGFEIFLKTEARNNHNSAMKMMQIFKKIYRIALENRLTDSNAFAGKKLTFTDVEMAYLTNEEISLLMNRTFKMDRLNYVRDLFIFCCYTGLAYIDLKNLQRKHFEYNPVKKQFFIKKKRQKTNQPFIIPLFQPAEMILNSRVVGWQHLHPDVRVFSVISNQKYNANLKEVAAFCGIEKNLTSHLARHTFATSVLLENGVSMESTSKMLGHSKISQTQKYGKVTEIKIERDTRELFLQLSLNPK